MENINLVSSNIPVLLLLQFLVFLFIHTTHFVSSIFERWNYPNRRARARLPPGPFRFPILGNLLDLGKKPHRSLAKIAKRHGPLVSLQLGCTTTVVVSSPSIAQEMFQKLDPVLSNRSVAHSATVFDHPLNSMAFLPLGQKWRYLKKIWSSHVVSPARIDAWQDLRMKKVEELISYLKQKSETKTAVNIGEMVFINSVNILSNKVFSMDIANFTGPKSAGNELKDIISDVLQEVGKPNISDFFPALKPFDLQGCYRRSKGLIGKMLNYFDNIIEQRLKLMNDSHIEDKDILDSLLRINKEEKSNGASDTEPIKIPHFILDIFIAGTDTTSTTIEWAIAELLHHPEKMKKAQEELDHVIGANILRESDIPRLSYLNAVIKETMRLHPPAPFLVPRKADAEVELHGYKIPKDAQVLVNVWAIGRDDKVWENPTIFEPERFIESKIDLKGKNYEFLPFGAGRRICIGIPLALKIFPLVLGSLIHRFDWKIDDGMMEIDMEDRFGLALQRDKPLWLVPCYRVRPSV